MTTMRWVNQVDQELEDSKVSQNRQVWGKILHFPLPDPHHLAEKHEDVLDRLMCEPQLDDMDIGCTEAPQKLRLLKFLRHKTFYKRDAKLRHLAEQARKIIAKGRFDLAGRRVDHAGLTQALTQASDPAIRRQANQYRQALEERLAPLARQMARRRNLLAQRYGYRDYPAWIAAQNGLPVDGIERLYDRLLAIIAPENERFLQSLGLGATPPYDDAQLFYALETAPRRPAICPPTREHLEAGRIPPALLKMTGHLGFDSSVKALKTHISNLPLNGLTVMVAPPEEIYVISAPFDSFRCWRVMFHEFGHALYALYNRQAGYTFKWEEAPCFQEAMAQTFNHLLIRTDVLKLLFQTNLEAFAADQQRVDLWRLQSWTQSAKQEAALYEASNQGEQETGDLGSACDSVYTIFYPFHFLNMLLGDLIARQLLQVMPGQPADWLIQQFYQAGSSLDWQLRLQQALGLAGNTPDKILESLVTNLEQTLHPQSRGRAIA